MKQDLPNWSLFSFLDQGGQFVGSMMGSQKDTAGKVAGWLIGVAIVACFAPIALGGFILLNGFRVGTKTWVYLIMMIILAIVFGLLALFQ